jgi:Glycosyltransferase family 87
MVTFALLAYYPVFYTIGIGQLSLLLAVSAFELFRALEGRRPLTAAVWLIVLSIKPQLLPPLVLLLALRRHWRTLGWAAALGVGVAAICAALLGASIWLDYLRNVRALEQFFAAGTPAYMMNLRGALTRVLGQQVSPAGVYLVAMAAWMAAMVALALVLIRRGAAGGSDLRTEFGLTLAVALFFNPHLFPQDAVIWIVALSLHIAGLRARRQSPTLFSAFALSWPIWFAVSRALDLSAGPQRLSLTPAMVVMGVALVWMAWTDQLIGADVSLPAGP